MNHHPLDLCTITDPSIKLFFLESSIKPAWNFPYNLNSIWDEQYVSHSLFLSS